MNHWVFALCSVEVSVGATLTKIQAGVYLTGALGEVLGVDDDNRLAFETNPSAVGEGSQSLVDGLT